MFAGNDTPATVAGFFPVALQRLTIAIPHVPTDSHIQAAFDVSNLAVRAFGLEPSRVDIVSIGTNVTPDDLGGNGSTESGFTRWPQVALPELNVAFDDKGLDAVAASLITVASMQATTTSPINVSMKDRLEGGVDGPLLAVVSNATTPSFLNAPLPGPGVKLVGDENETLVSLESNVELTSLQAYENDNKNILLLAGPNSASLRSLSSVLANHNDGWFSLHGDTWFRAGDQTPASVKARGGALRIEPIAPATSTILERHRGFFIAGAVAIVIALLALLYPRMVADRPVSGAHAENGGLPGGRRASDHLHEGGELGADRSDESS